MQSTIQYSTIQYSTLLSTMLGAAVVPSSTTTYKISIPPFVIQDISGEGKWCGSCLDFH